MKRIEALAVMATILSMGGAASAQGPGVRAGVSGDPAQFYGGVHVETADLADRLRFRPNLEIGVGDNVTLVAVNLEFVYRIELQRRSMWNLYMGGGPALNVYRTSRDTNADGGFNILVGLQHARGLFTEFKVGAIASPGVKVGVGYRFGR